MILSNNLIHTFSKNSIWKKVYANYEDLDKFSFVAKLKFEDLSLKRYITEPIFFKKYIIQKLHLNLTNLHFVQKKPP